MENPSNDNAGLSKPVTSTGLFDILSPLGTQFSFGTAMGLSSGFALQRFGRLAGIAVGATFCAVQGLSYLGYIQVDWRKVQQDYTLLFDRTGDGKVTLDDFDLIFNDIKSVLEFNVPGGTGFTAGLVYGLSGNFKVASALGGVYGVGGAILRGAAATSFPALLVAGKHEMDHLADEHVDALSNGQNLGISAGSVKAAFEKSLDGRSLDELRAIERELKQDLMLPGLLKTQPDLKQELLNKVECAKVEEKKSTTKTSWW